MHLDNFSCIGKSHQICEDYTLIGETPLFHLIVSDGCSSSERTDIGARILSCLFQKSLHLVDDLKSYKGEYFLSNLMNRAKEIASSLNVPASALDCTLNVCWKEGREIHVNFYGDGFLVYKSKGLVFIEKISYEANAPYYLSVSTDLLKKHAWQNVFPKNRLSIDYISAITEYNLFQSDFYYSKVFLEDDIEFLMISSDGIGSFIKNDTGESIPIKEVVSEILDIKIKQGEYLKRRMKKMMEKYRLQGIFNYDDISIASIIF